MTSSVAPTGATPTARTTLAQRFASISEADYVRDVLAVILLAISLALPAKYSDAGTPVSDGLYMAVVAIAALALVFPYASRFGLLPNSWTVHRTRAVRLVLALPFVALYLWHAFGAYAFTDSAPLGVGSAFAVGGAGVALAAQARHSELGDAASDKGAGKTSRLVATILAVLVAVGYLGTAIYLLTSLNLTVTGSILILILVLGGGAIVALPALSVVLKQTRAWASLVAGLGIAIVAFVYLSANDTASLVPKFETFAIWGDPALYPVTLSIGFGLFLIPALGAVVTSPAFLRETKRNTPLEGRLDLAAITLRVIALVGVAIAITHLAWAFLVPSPSLRYLRDGFMGDNIASGIAGLVVAVVAFLALRSFNKNPGTSRAPIIIALVISVILSLVINSLSPYSGRSLGQLFLLLALPAIGAYAMIGNHASREFFAQASKSRPEPAEASYNWKAKPAAAPAKVIAVPVAPGANPESSGAQAHGSAGRSNAYSGVSAPTVQSAATGAVSVSPETNVAPQTTGSSVTAPTQPSHDAAGTPATQGVESVSSEPHTDTNGVLPAPTSGETAIIPAVDDLDIPDEQTVTNARNHAPQSAQTEMIERTLQPTSGALSSVAASASHGYSEAEALDPATPAIVLAKIAEVAPELRPALAKNPSTYPALVEWLRQLGDPDVDAALAQR